MKYPAAFAGILKSFDFINVDLVPKLVSLDSCMENIPALQRSFLITVYDTALSAQIIMLV